MGRAAETRFLNCDLELDSPRELGPLSAHLNGKVLILFDAEVETGWYRLAVEPLDDELDADGCIQHLAGLLSDLPPELLRLWRGCRSRVFDLGFEGGANPLPYVTDLRPATLRALADLEARLRVTFYPPN